MNTHNHVVKSDIAIATRGDEATRAALGLLYILAISQLGHHRALQVASASASGGKLLALRYFANLRDDEPELRPSPFVLAGWFS